MDERVSGETANGFRVFPFGGGEMGALIARRDWSDSSLGDPQTWDGSLRSAASLLLASKFPMFLAWGPTLGLIYNDAYAPILGIRHPDALGHPLAEVWSDSWSDIAPFVDAALAGDATSSENLPFVTAQDSCAEQTDFTSSYSPVFDAAGRIVGVFCVCKERTERLLADERITAERIRQHRLFEQAPGFIAISTGPDHVFEFANEAYLKVVGRRDLIGKTFREALPDLEGQGLYELHDKVYSTGERIVAEQVAVRMQPNLDADFEERFVDVIYEPVVDGSGRVTGIFTQGYDVTDAHRAREALLEARATAEKQSAERAAILGHLAEGVIVTDEVGRITYVNDSAARLHGVLRLDIAPDDYSETYHLFTEDGRRFPPQDLPLARAVRGEIVPETRWRIRRPDGSEVLAIGCACPVMSGSGERLGAVLTLRDDTEREAGERLLRENEARLRALTDNLPSGMVYQLTTGRDGSERRFLYVSQSHEKLTGVCAEEVLADPNLPYMMILPKHRAAVAKAEAKAIRDLAPFDVEVQFRRADGQVRWCRILSAPRSQADGSLIWDGLQIDVTDQKDAEAHLHLLVNELNHRVKNSLATVQALAAKTFRGSVSMEHAKSEFFGRLRALAHAHDVLTEKNWAEANLWDVIERTVSPHRGGSGDRFRIKGPSVALQPKAALALSMAIHELCTNAVKYGALSSEVGIVAIEWTVQGLPERQRLNLKWTEHGGPAVTPPEQTGFGSRLIKYGLAAELGGDVTIAYPPAGVTCVIQAPLPAH